MGGLPLSGGKQILKLRKVGTIIFLCIMRNTKGMERELTFLEKAVDAKAFPMVSWQSRRGWI